ncbi:MAG: helix-turn-helix transcriptional regulator [Chloroflexi bacterium]|nr:helix-turn-helix transcriptional regulator [Chloroflexota bacterium]
MLKFVSMDYRDETIAEILKISATTVKFHLRNAKKKLGVSSRAAAVYKAWQDGILN